MSDIENETPNRKLFRSSPRGLYRGHIYTHVSGAKLGRILV
jgi:hypothetical protein